MNALGQTADTTLPPHTKTHSTASKKTDSSSSVFATQRDNPTSDERSNNQNSSNSTNVNNLQHGHTKEVDQRQRSDSKDYLDAAGSNSGKQLTAANKPSSLTDNPTAASSTKDGNRRTEPNRESSAHTSGSHSNETSSTHNDDMMGGLRDKLMNAKEKLFDTFTHSSDSNTSNSDSSNLSSSDSNNISSNDSSNFSHSGSNNNSSKSSSYSTSHSSNSGVPFTTTGQPTDLLRDDNRIDSAPYPTSYSNPNATSVLSSSVQQQIDSLPSSRKQTLHPDNDSVDGSFSAASGSDLAAADATRPSERMNTLSTPANEGMGGIRGMIGETYNNAKEKLFDTFANTFHIQHQQPSHENFIRENFKREDLPHSLNSDAHSDVIQANNESAANPLHGNSSDNTISTGDLRSSMNSAKETIQKDYDMAKDKISETYDMAKEKMSDLGSSFSGKGHDTGSYTNESFERDSSLGLTVDSAANTSLTKDSAYITSVGASLDGAPLTNETAVEAGARLANATEQMTEL
jgi:hypothetical protein